MEKENNIHKTNIMWPHPENGIVVVDTPVDFVYIMRKDADFATNPIAQKLSDEYFLDSIETQQILLQEYDIFTAKLAEILLSNFSHKGSVEIHMYDPDILDHQIRRKAGNDPIISLDPLMSKEVFTHGVSRGYYLSGQKDFGQVARPGMASLSDQANNISNKLHGKPAVVSEDDIFSGGSVIASLQGLLEKGTNIHTVIPGIQVGVPEKLAEMGVAVDPVIKYETADGTDIFDKVDLGDPRDYLAGASGLVIKLPNGNCGRTPYVLPFVSPTARAGIPKEAEKVFSLDVLQANKQFFSAIERKIGKPVLLKHMHPDFVAFMHDLHNFDHQTPMEQVIVWGMNTIDDTWKTHQEFGFQYENIERLQLPKSIVFLDVNGTLFPDDSSDGYISPKNIQKLQDQINNLQKNNISVGLCSDSPLLQLQQLAQTLGISGPIIAENGNLVVHQNISLVINALPDVHDIKKQIESAVITQGFTKREDIIAPEFGGTSFSTESNQWAFGANRLTSVSVFGPTELIKMLGELTSNNPHGIDCSPEYGYFAIHPGKDFRQNKGSVLSLLAAYGHNVLMIGNSMSDWVDPKNTVACAFVAESRITEDVKAKAYLSDKTNIDGVFDILDKIV